MRVCFKCVVLRFCPGCPMLLRHALSKYASVSSMSLFRFSRPKEYKGWRMVKSEIRRDAEILAKNLSQTLLGIKSFETQKSKNQTMQKRVFETYRKCFRNFEILPFAALNIYHWDLLLHRLLKHSVSYNIYNNDSQTQESSFQYKLG